MTTAALTVRFWGVRGSTPTPGPRYQRYGGNTSCVEVRHGPHLLILDAGTGLRELGLSLPTDPPLDADLLLTHTHLDHIGGLPFFGPIYETANRFVLWAGHLAPERTLEGVLHEFMADPVFPIPPSRFAAHVRYRDFKAGEVLHPREGVVVRTGPLNHPNRATGYRIEAGGRSVCYVTDTEHRDGERDADIVALVQGADVLIYDSTFSDEEYPRFRGWGHSTWQEGVRLADAARVAQLVVFHHDPSHDDEVMDRIAAEVAEARPGTVVAREGLVLTLA
ncbi:MAG: MBL fold metallo-hydrolase [Myxococcota bacterium]